MKKYALLVGVEDYRDKMIARLNFACADATALAERLSGRCGFDHVRLLAGQAGDDVPDQLNVLTALRDIASELRPEDLFLFFFAGHGIEIDGQGYLLTCDSSWSFPEQGSLSLGTLQKTFGRLAASRRAMIVDACRNSPDAAKGDAGNRMGEGLCRDIAAAARANTGTGMTTALLSSCRSGQRAREWPARGHGVFSQFLIEGIDGAAWKADELELEGLASYAAKGVRRWCASTPGVAEPQDPWYEKFGDPGAILLAVGSPGSASPATRSKPASPPAKFKPTPSEPSVLWWVIIDGQEQGPLDEAAIRDAIKQGKITRKTECWRDGMDNWQPIGQTTEWAGAFPPLPKTPAARPPRRGPSIHLPDFLEPVPTAKYARLGRLNPGSEAAQKRQMECVAKGYPLEVAIKRTGIVFRLIPPGEFLMGSTGNDSEAVDDEKPQHKVTMAYPIYVGKFPVTQKQWQDVMGRNADRFQTGMGLEKGSKFQEEKRLEAGTQERPVEFVSWDDCRRLLNRVHDQLDLGFGKAIRLPAEAEWEYACRAGTTDSRYGNLEAIGWFDGNSGGMACPVGQKRPNAWGLCDMIGNAWEWCEDTYHDGYKNAPTNGSAWEGGDTARVMRGGGFYNPGFCRSASRYWSSPDFQTNDVGF